MALANEDFSNENIGGIHLRVLEIIREHFE